MATQFSEVFSRLRKERGISQRNAAEDLGISQALLSHYENGIREPRLDFVVRACDYYGVSADYILGRTAAKENLMASDGLFPNEASSGAAERRDGGNMRDLTAYIAVIFRILRDKAGDAAADSAANYLTMAVFKIFSYLDIDDGDTLLNAVSLPKTQLNALCDAAFKIAEASLAGEISRNAGKNSGVKYAERLKDEFPNAYKSIRKLIENADFKIMEMQGQR